jgi:hypothetical protein
MKRHIIPALFLFLLLFPLVISCSSGGNKNNDNPPLIGKLPAPLAEQYVIDGIVDFSSLPTATHQVISMIDSLGTGTVVSTTTLTWTMMHDERNLYVAMEWASAATHSFDPAVGLTDFDGVIIMFDSDGSGTFEVNEDAKRIVMTTYGSAYTDIHNVLSGDDTDEIGDGQGKMVWSNGVYHAEFMVPLAGDANGQDGVGLSASSRFNINILDHIQFVAGVPVAGNVGSLSGPGNMSVGMSTNNWPLLPLAASGPYDQPQIATDLTGTIAFISSHENPLGDIYTFNPRTKEVKRVTNTSMYIDGISLSHDRKKIAFYGGASSDFAAAVNWEIYTVNVDGTELKSITSNSWLDGHPAWSPDDSKIVYASFRDGTYTKASLIISTATGSELVSNLTPSGWNDNDPDWTPDGRIVFKTDRFGTAGSPELRIAVMKADGSAVSQVTFTTGSSDHDPTATNTVAVFERFTKNTDYSTDPSTPYSAWNIVEAHLDGSGERTLVADGWVNWLPVHDPTGQYMVYLKNVGYTDARLMDKNGRDLGRLIPISTKIRYIDWK